MGSPNKFAHIVYKTHQFQEMIAWYAEVFDAQIQHQDDHLAFLTYDDEHHRFAFLNLGGGESPTDTSLQRPGAGVHHVAYTWDSLDQLLDQYQLLKVKGVLPQMNLRHGPTLSMYYADPDGNGLEFQIDLLSVDAANAFMRSDAFASNNIGEPFDPQELIELRAAGKPVAAKLVRTDQSPVDEPA